MRSFFLLANACVIALVSWPATVRADDPGPVIYRAMAPGTLLIRATGPQKDGGVTSIAGTGFVISPEGHVLTASHMVPDASSHVSLTITATRGPSTAGAEAYQLELVERSKRHDVALLRMVKSPPGLTVLPLRKSSPQVGEVVFVMGYPFELPKTHFLEGRIGNVETDAITTSVLIDKGNSGGPVLDSRGCVIGVVYGAIERIAGEPVNQLKFAVPIPAVFDLLPASAVAAPHMPATPQADDLIHVSNTLSRTQTDHGLNETIRSYRDVIPARDGYEIEEIETVGQVSLNPPRLQYPVPVIASDKKSMSGGR